MGTVKVAGSMVILVILFGLVSCNSGVTPTLTTPTSSPVTKTPEDSNVTCCDTILLSSTDDYIYHAGIWSLYTSNPTFNGRKVYKMKNSCSGDYCLYWSSNVWRVSQCQYITYDYPNGIMYESANSKKCPHDSDLVWPRLKRNHTMKFSCMTGCNSPPPTSPSYRNSDWDGSTLTAGPGTVVTYTCSFPSACNHVTSQCDPQSLQWTSLSSVPDCFYCNSPSFGLNYSPYSPYTAGVYSPFVHSIDKREAEPKADAALYHSVYSPTTYTFPGYTGYTGYSGLTYPTYSPYTAGVYSPFVHSIGKREAEPAADADAALYHSVYSPTIYTFPRYTGYTGYSGLTGYTAPRVYSNLFNNFYHHY